MKNSFIGNSLLDEALINNPFIGICITDADGYVLAVNKAHSKITGIPYEEATNKLMKDFVDNKTIPVSATMEVIKSKTEVSIHQILNTGKSYDVKAVPVFDEKGKLSYIVSYMLDITSLVEAKESLRQLEKDKEDIEKKYRELKEVITFSGKLIYASPQMKNIIDTAEKIAKTTASVLITGPTGSGKEVVANFIQEESNRKDKPFVKINCSAIPESLLESELFGYEAGSFTGGNKNGKAGIFEIADGGTLLLDEIGDMPLNLQAKLLRTLQEKEIRRIGASKTTKVDVRIIASTNVSIQELIADKKFREDLYYRLNVIEIKIPPLCERKADIPLLIDFFIKYYNEKYQYDKTLSRNALMYLYNKNYPGNVRELKNITERIVIQGPEDIVTMDDVSLILNPDPATSSITSEKNTNHHSAEFNMESGLSLKEMVEKYEKKILSDLLAQNKSITDIAEQLNSQRSTISKKISRYGLK